MPGGDLMAEGANVEIAHSLAEAEHEHAAHEGWHRVLEILEVVLLAVVAIVTAWSGYQAAQWDGEQSVRYGHSSRDRFAADAASTLGEQRLAADAGIFTAWLQAHTAGDAELQALLVKRFSPEYRVAFDAWLATDPFTSPDAPLGPGAMPEYQNPDIQKAARLNASASEEFDEGTEARHHGEEYVRNTVLFAMVLFLVAIAQRMKDRTLRASVNALALALALFAIVSTVTLPRL
jgi:hypothetical protein